MDSYYFCLKSDDYVQKIKSYMDSFLFEPQSNWAKAVFKERVYSRWAVFEAIDRIVSNPFSNPDDVLYGLMIEFMYRSTTTKNKELINAYYIGIDALSDLMSYLSER